MLWAFRNYLLTTVVFVLLSFSLFAQDSNQISKKSLDISNTRGSIKIDGQLDDPGWQDVSRVSDFTENNPGDQIEALVKTEAMLTYDDDNLYVAIVCHDDPQTIRASLCERDQIFNDDNAGIFIDTYGDAALAYEFYVNPYGIQQDQLWSSNGGEDITFDLLWKSAGTITDSGYQVELAIPFSSIRFPNTPGQVWKVDFWRNHPRETLHQYAWTPYDRDESCWACQWATVTGINDVTPGKGIEIIASVIGFESSNLCDIDSCGEKSYDYFDPDGDVSIGAKYPISSSLTLEAVYNPDFSQIEADATQIDVNTSEALFFPERRPFFQEGSDLFQVPMNLVYTRTINDPLFAAKLIGRMGRTSVAYLGAYDEHTPIIVPFEKSSYQLLAGKSFSNILRVRQTFGSNSRIGLLMTDRRLKGGGSGSVISLDGSIRLSKNLNYTLLMIGTHVDEPTDSMISESILDDIEDGLVDPTFDKDKYTRYYDGESFWGHGFFTGISHEGRNLFVNLTYLETTPTYRTDNGYRSKNDQRGPRLHGQYTFRFDEGNKFLVNLTPSVRLGREWNFDNERNYEFVTTALEVRFKAQTSMHAAYTTESIRYREEMFKGIYSLHNCAHSAFGKKISFGGNINYGHQLSYGYLVKGKEVSWGAWLELRPVDQMLIEMSFRHVKSNSFEEDRIADATLPEILYKDHTLWGRVNYQFSRKLSLRLVTQYSDSRRFWSVDPLLTYRMNAFSVLYVGSSYGYQDYEGLTTTIGDETVEIPNLSWEMKNRQFFTKFQYLFQI
jgi:hypothetical protein